jgi:endonuclease/exonuclease/phosphatase family metal-dependent hydrolase
MRTLTIGLAALGLMACSDPAGNADDAAPHDATPHDAAPVDAAAPHDAAPHDAAPVDAAAPPEGWCATQWPPDTATAAGYCTERLYARVRIPGVTPTGGANASLVVELGHGPHPDPPTAATWTWTAAAHNAACAGCTDDDEWMGSLTPTMAGDQRWAVRVRYNDSGWLQGDRADEGRTGSDDGWQSADAPTLRVSAPGEVKVVSLNLRCLLDDWDARLALIVSALAGADPDLMGFEEACAEPDGRDNLVELVDALSAATGRDYSVHRVVTHWSWDLYDEGLAVVAPHALRHADDVELPAGAFTRRVIRTRIVTPQGPLVMATTHLDHLSGDVRATQIAAVRDALADLAGVDEAVVLTGDLNEGPDGAVWPTLDGAGYTDLWDALHPGDPGYTFPAPDPTIRIDYVWLHPGASGFGPGAIARILDQEVGGVTGSDHLGLSASITR